MAYVDHHKGERKQERTTPIDFFVKLDARFHFTMDGAASEENALLPRYSSIAKPLSWHKERVFCNPPWSSIAEFMETAVDFEAEPEFACFLVPARVNAKWFHRALTMGAVPEFFCGRLTFDRLRLNSPVDCLLLKFGKF
jgi:hypothetical protein